MTGGLVLSADEVRVLGQLAGAEHAGALVPDVEWEADDLPVADIVASRTLLARGLLRLGTGSAVPDSVPELVLAPEARALFGAPGVLFAVRRDGVAGARRATLVGSLLAEELSPAVWRLRCTAEPHVHARALVDELTCGVAESAAVSDSITLPTKALEDADRLAGEAGESAAADLLADCGLAAEQALTVAGVLARRTAITTVRLTRQDGTTTLTATLTWLEAGAESWLAVPDAAGPDDPPGADTDAAAYLPMPDQLDEVTRLLPVNRADLRAALDGILAGLTPAEARS